MCGKLIPCIFLVGSFSFLAFVSGTNSRQMTAPPHVCKHADSPKHYTLEVPVFSSQTIPAYQHSTSKLECHDLGEFVRIDVHKIGRRFHGTIQACRNVVKILVHLKSPGHFRNVAGSRKIVSCDRRRDTLLLLYPPNRQVVTISPALHKESSNLSLSWTYQYITRANGTQWSYMDSPLELHTPNAYTALVPEPSVLRDKRSNVVQVVEPVPKEEKPQCGKDISCVRFGPANCGHMECEYLLTYSMTNHTFLELEISAKVEGWVALGLSSDNKMSGVDVIVCKKKSVFSIELQALSMWINLQHTRPKLKSQNQLNLDSQKVKDGYIYCKINTTNAKQDTGSDNSLELTNNWYQLYAKGKIDKNGVMLQHTLKPPTSTRTITMLRPFYTHSKKYTQLKDGASSFHLLSSSSSVSLYIFIPLMILYT